MLHASREISFDDVIFVDRTVFSKVHWDIGVMILQFHMVLSASVFHLYLTITWNLCERGEG